MPMKRHHGVSYFWSSTLTIAANLGATLAIVVRTIQPVVLWLLCHRTRGLDVDVDSLSSPLYYIRARLQAGSVQLYNIASDPRESQDQASAQPIIVARLMAALRKYKATAEPAYICGARGNFNVGGALTPWCAAGGEQSGCTSPPPNKRLA